MSTPSRARAASVCAPGAGRGAGALPRVAAAPGSAREAWTAEACARRWARRPRAARGASWPWRPRRPGAVGGCAAPLAPRRPGATEPAHGPSVEEGPFHVSIVEAGTLQALRSVTYASTIQSNQAKIVALAPEGKLVQKDDLSSSSTRRPSRRRSAAARPCSRRPRPTCRRRSRT